MVKRNEYVPPEAMCPFCKAPLLACNGEDGPFEIFVGEGPEVEKHEVRGSETWACGTKRIGRCGYGEDYHWDRHTQTRRDVKCYQDVDKKRDSELFWAKQNLETAQKEIADLKKKLDDSASDWAEVEREKARSAGDLERLRTKLIEVTGVCDVCGMPYSEERDGVVTCNHCGCVVPVPLKIHKGGEDA